MAVPAVRVFQSTPTNFMAGDMSRFVPSGLSATFQSTPTNFMAGDRADSVSAFGS